MLSFNVGFFGLILLMGCFFEAADRVVFMTDGEKKEEVLESQVVG
jgi:hypothetical protein